MKASSANQNRKPTVAADRIDESRFGNGTFRHPHYGGGFGTLDDAVPRTHEPDHWHDQRQLGTAFALVRAAVRAFASLPRAQQENFVREEDLWSAEDVIRAAQCSVETWDEEEGGEPEVAQDAETAGAA